MRPFHLIMQGADAPEPRRVDFEAESPDHAFQVARNETDGTQVELWEGSKLLARMTKGDANIWQLLPVRPDNVVAIDPAVEPTVEPTVATVEAEQRSSG